MEPLLTGRPEDLPGLAMENELFRYEVTHLRARLASAEQQLRSIARAQAESASLKQAAEPSRAPEEVPGRADEPAPGPAAQAAPPRSASPGAPQARSDLVWLLTRLDSSPASLLLRRRPRYRELVDRYLGVAPRDG